MDYFSPYSPAIYENTALWYAMAHPEEARLASLPLATLTSLYPEVAMLGPNTPAVMLLFNDFAAIKDRFEVVRVEEALVLLSELDAWDETTRARHHLRAFADDVTNHVGELVTSLRFSCPGNFCRDEDCMETVLTTEQSGLVQNLIWEALILVAFEGFVDFELVSKEPEAADVRDAYNHLFDQILAAFYLNASDYIQY